MSSRMRALASIGAGSLIAVSALWLLAASRLFLVFTGLDGSLTDPWMRATAWWAYANSSYVSIPSVKIMLVASAIVPLLPVILVAGLVLRSPRARKKLKRQFGGRLRPIESGVTENHGRARWPTVAEMLARYPGPSADHGGVVIGEARRIDLEPVKDIAFKADDRSTWGEGGRAPLLIDPCETGSTHSLVFGGSGSYKTMSAVSTQIHWTGSLVSFDPSCEIGPMMREYRRSLGQEVVCLGYGPDDVGINALACIRPDLPGAAARVLSMTASICGEEVERKDSNAVFSSAGRNLVACLIAHMLWDKKLPAAQKTIKTLVNGLTIPEAEMKEFLRVIYATSDSSLARRLAGSLMEIYHQTFSGAYFNATQMTGWVMDEENASLLSGTLDPAAVLKGDMSVYIQTPLATLSYAPGVARVIVDSIVNSVILADGAFAQRILLQADEAYLLGNMKSLEVVLRQGRKYGLTMQLIYTSADDMETVWTEKGMQTWLNNVSWASYAAIASQKTAKRLSEEVGKYGVLAYSEGQNKGFSGQTFGSGSRSKGDNTNVHEISRDLIKPEEFKDSRTDEAFVFPRSGRPFRCGLAPWFRRPEMVEQIKGTTFHRPRAA